MNLGELAIIAKEKKLSALAIKNGTGISRHAVSRIFKGKGRAPFNQVKAILDYMGYKLQIVRK